MKQRIAWLLVWMSLAALGGCGGGGGSSEPPAAERPPDDVVPGEAGGSIAGLKRVIEALVASPTDDREPLGLGGLVPPVAEDAEPEPLG